MFNQVAVDAATRVTTVWPWYLTRASGVVAAVILALLMITGITAFTGHQFKFMAPLKSWANHRVLGISFAVAVAVHVGSLLFDKYITFNPSQILVPFLSPYKQVSVLGLPAGSIGVAMGVFALYLGALIILTSLTRIFTSMPQLWKSTHYSSYAIVILIFIHSLMIGTDFKDGIWRFGWVILNIIVLGFIGLRLSRTGSLKE
jgi:methionine sulfoxide reductase heme-binding subunit